MHRDDRDDRPAPAPRPAPDGPPLRRLGDKQALDRLASRQHGVVTTEEARRLGFAASTLARRAAAGTAERRHRGVYAVGGAPDGHVPRVAAAVASVPGGAATGLTALRLLGLDLPAPDRIQVVTRAEHRPRRGDLDLIRSTKLTGRDVTTVDAIRCARPAWAITDASRWLDATALAAALVDLEQAGLRAIAPLSGLLKRRTWFPGRTRVRDALDAVTRARFRSLLEVLGEAALRPLAPFEVNHAVDVHGGRVEVDLAWPERRVAAEWHGFAWHRSAEDLRRDAERHNLLTEAGWTYAVFTWGDLARPDAVVAALTALLDR